MIGTLSMSGEHTKSGSIGQTLQSILRESFGRDLNEATMTANVLIPVLQKLFAETQLEAECTMSLQFGVSTVTIDTKKSSKVNARADFFLRDKATDKVIAVVEAKKPSHALDEADDEQVKSYMRAILPLVPYGIVVNANEPSRLFGWRDGDIVKLDESSKDPLSSFPTSIDKELVQSAINALMRVTPAYRDDAINQISRRKLSAAGMPSRSPRTVLQGLTDRIQSTEATVSFVTSPPKCGKSQVLQDFAAELSSSPVIFIEQHTDQQYALKEALDGFEVDGKLSDPLIVRFLKARPSTNCPIYILIDASTHSQELIELILFFSETPHANAHMVISASFQVTRKLLFRDDFTPFANSVDAIAVLEIGAFTDKELVTVFPENYVETAKAPFGRFLRWPGLCHAVRPDTSLGDTLCSWFQSCPIQIRRAMNILGADLAEANDWSADRLPATFVRNQPQELDVLLECGFVIELLRPRSGLSDYGFSCIEIALYALLSHIFEAAAQEDRGRAMDAFVARWKRVQSEQEMVALAAILPTFLAGLSGDPLDRIVRYMLSISFGSYVLETMSRSELFVEYATFVDSQVGSPMDISHRRPPFELLRKALLIFRERVGLMPDFAELERELKETVRFFDGKRNPILNVKLSCEQWQDRGILLKLGRSALLDSLYLLSKGDISWLPKGIDREAVRRIATAIADAASPYRSRFPIESDFDDLVDIITRRAPRDLPLLLRSKRWWSGDQLSASESHIKNLSRLVIDAYSCGSWEYLSDCFAYFHGMSTDLMDVLLTGLLEVGSPENFANVLINFPHDLFGELPMSIQKRLLGRLMDMDKDVVRVVAHLDQAVLQEIRYHHPETFGRISELVWESQVIRSILRVLASRGVVTKSVREADFWRLVARLDVASLCVALSTSKFFDELFSVIPIPIGDVRAAMHSSQAGSGWELLLEAMCLLERNGKHIVDDEKWLQALHSSNLVTEEWVRNAPDPEKEGLSTHWSLDRCREYIRSTILQAVEQNELQQLDRILRSALLNVHDSKFNRIYIRVAVEVTQQGHADYRKLVAKRLILSGFDLWAVQVGYTCPMLRELLRDVSAALNPAEQDEWIAWILRHYHRLRMLPSFDTYSIRELISIRAIRENFLGKVFDKIPEDIQFLLPLVDMSLSSFGEHTEELAEALLKEIEESTEGIVGFYNRFPDELKHIQAFAPKQEETNIPMLSADEVLDAFEQATKAVPQLPTVLPAWSGRRKVRSMLSPIEEGYRSYTREEFRDSLPVAPH